MAALDNNGTQAMVEKAKGERERLETGRSRVSALVTLAVVGGIALLLALVVGETRTRRRAATTGP